MAIVDIHVVKLQTKHYDYHPLQVQVALDEAAEVQAEAPRQPQLFASHLLLLQVFSAAVVFSAVREKDQVRNRSNFDNLSYCCFKVSQ